MTVHGHVNGGVRGPSEIKVEATGYMQGSQAKISTTRLQQRLATLTDCVRILEEQLAKNATKYRLKK
jgi:hypothetical protein